MKPPPPPAAEPTIPPPPPSIDATPPAPSEKKKKKKLKPSERRTKLRDRLWPGAETQIWHRLHNDGFITIPKLLSLICALLKEIAANEPTRVYLDLWCRSYDEGIIENIDEDEAAFSSGYVGTRAKRTWTDHMYQLEKLGFIKIAPYGNSPVGHVLLLNPLYVVDELRRKQKSKVTDEWWNAYIGRASVIGAVLPSDEDDADGV
jgi:hypothetical protein